MNASVAARNAAIDAVTALLNSGDVRFHNSSHAEVATCAFGATAFGAAASASATANAISDDSSAAGGTIDHAHLRKSDGTEIIDLTVGTSGADINMSTLTVNAGDKVSISSMTMSMAAS